LAEVRALQSRDAMKKPSRLQLSKLTVHHLTQLSHVRGGNLSDPPASDPGRPSGDPGQPVTRDPGQPSRDPGQPATTTH